MKVNFYQDGRDSLLKFAVIVSKSEGKWVFCRHRERDTYEFPGGHREKGENIEEAARRELYEETGAVKYDLKKVCIYSVVREDGLDTESSESFGMLFYADIYQFSPLPAFEIERIELMDSLPDNWTYPDIQPWLLKKIKEWEEDQRCQPFEAVYSSVTGNTKMLAEIIQKAGPKQCLYCGPPESAGKTGADLIFAGFWTDKGSCTEPFAAYLKSLHGKRIFLFGTAGFGGSPEYFQGILERVSGFISSDNEQIGSFMCQGKMPEAVKKRYEDMAKKNPDDERILSFLNNYEKALAHPDEKDLFDLKSMAEKFIKGES